MNYTGGSGTSSTSIEEGQPHGEEEGMLPPASGQEEVDKDTYVFNVLKTIQVGRQVNTIRKLFRGGLAAYGGIEYSKPGNQPRPCLSLACPALPCRHGYPSSQGVASPLTFTFPLLKECGNPCHPPGIHLEWADP